VNDLSYLEAEELRLDQREGLAVKLDEALACLLFSQISAFIPFHIVHPDLSSFQSQILPPTIAISISSNPGNNKSVPCSGRRQ
jgi:hypothetical protein